MIARWRRLITVEEIANNDAHGKLRVVWRWPNDSRIPPKQYTHPSAFTPENLLREPRGQKKIAKAGIPDICVLDPDGDVVRSLLAPGEARLQLKWACYHTQLYSLISGGGIDLGIVRCAVGAPYAVLVAEEVFASGRKLLISVTSSARLCGYASRLISSLSNGRCAMPAIPAWLHPIVRMLMPD